MAADFEVQALTLFQDASRAFPAGSAWAGSAVRAVRLVMTGGHAVQGR